MLKLSIAPLIAVMFLSTAHAGPKAKDTNEQWSAEFLSIKNLSGWSDEKIDFGPETKIASFGDDSSIQYEAQEFYKFLEDIGFGDAYQKLFESNAKITGIYDDASLRNAKVVHERYMLIAASPTQKNLLDFFVFGRSADSNAIFSSHPALLEKMLRLGLIVKGQGKHANMVRLNDLSLGAYKLVNDKTIYLFVDLPSHFGARREPSTMISKTSHSLLFGIEDRLDPKIKGNIADFGSGNGIQSIALLTIYPKIQKAYAVEIDPHSINLSTLNAAINGVGDRFDAIDNSDPSLLKKKLAGKKLDYAVSNPPYNIVPASLKKQFPQFGFGGTDGLNVTKIFLKQIDENLKDGGEAFFYSGLALDGNFTSLLEKFMSKKMPTYSVEYKQLSQGFGSETIGADSVDDYSVDIALTICHYYPKSSNCQREKKLYALAKKIEKDLRAAGVERLGVFFLLLKKGTNGGFTENKELVSEMPSSQSLNPERLGGVFKTIEEGPGGVVTKDMANVHDDTRSFCEDKAVVGIGRARRKIETELSKIQISSPEQTERLEFVAVDSVVCEKKGNAAGLVQIKDLKRTLTFRNLEDCQNFERQVAFYKDWGAASIVINEKSEILKASYYCYERPSKINSH